MSASHKEEEEEARRGGKERRREAVVPRLKGLTIRCDMIRRMERPNIRNINNNPIVAANIQIGPVKVWL